MTEVLVNVHQGSLKGKIGIDYAGRTFYSFQGIPYAKPPLGELRFKDPQPAEAWDGVRDATKEGTISYQRKFQTGKIIGGEDCLYLNVYTPQVNKDHGLMPVMFWIHGGGFFFGSGNSEDYGPEYLVARDIVLVTINYRLGILGFLKLEDSSLDIPGNAGLKDMVLALRWVKNNIQNFCGDPKNITIFGESAGSVAVNYLIYSPLAKNLFHKAIMQSGSVFNQWSKGFYNKEQYSKILNLSTTDEKEILNALLKLSAEDIFEVQNKLNDRPLEGCRRPFGPELENSSCNAFLTVDPKNAHSINEVPVLIGYNVSEGIFSVAFNKLVKKESIHNNFENLVPHDLNLNIGSDESTRIAQKIKNYYYKDREPSPEALDAFVALESDVHLVYGIHKAIEQLVEKSDQPIYFYKFSFDGKVYFFERKVEVPVEGASHADELSYLFTQPRNSKVKEDKDIQKTIKRMTKIWTNFAKYGNPNYKTNDESELLDVLWKPVKKGELNYVNIDKELTTGVNPDADRVAFWASLYKK